MTVKIPDPGSGDGASGDNEYVFRCKVRDNFKNSDNAASKTIGTDNNQVPLAQYVFKAANTRIDNYYSRTTSKDADISS